MKTDINSQQTSLSPAAAKALAVQRGPRLVILIPLQDCDDIRLVRRIRALASEKMADFPGPADILLLTLVNDPESELTARRHLATLAALAREPAYKLATGVDWGRSWIKIIHRNARPGDWLVCPAELTVTTGIGRHEILADILRRSPANPVEVYNGFFHTNSTGWALPLRKAVFWLAILGIFALFFWAEIAIDRTTQGWAHLTLTLLAIVVEVGSIYLFTSLIG